MTTTISGSSPGAPATAVLTPRPDVPGTCQIWVAAAYSLGAIVRGTLADPDAAGRVPRHRSTDARHLGVLTHGETRVLHYLLTNARPRTHARHPPATPSVADFRRFPGPNRSQHDPGGTHRRIARMAPALSPGPCWPVRDMPSPA